jgi:transposase
MSPGQPSPHCGELHYSAKLTNAAVRFIRASTMGCKRLARRFGVSKKAVQNARRRITWKCVK